MTDGPDSFLHVIPEDAVADAFQGSWKDITGRAEYLRSLLPGYRQVLIREDEPADLSADIQRAPRAALIEYTRFPRIQKWLRERGVRVAVRAHNIEPLQHRDNLGWFPPKGPLWMLYGMARLWACDRDCAQHCDHLLPISEWEAGHYWKRLAPPSTTVTWLPYFTPSGLISPSPIPLEQRRRILYLPHIRAHRKTGDGLRRLSALADRLGDDFEYCSTGEGDSTGRVRFLGRVDDIRPLLASALAVASLSPLGFGFKTTLADAIANGARGLVHPRVLSRCGSGLEDSLVAVDTDSAWNPASVREQLLRPHAFPGVHEGLRARATGVLRATFGLPDDRLPTVVQ